MKWVGLHRVAWVGSFNWITEQTSDVYISGYHDYCSLSDSTITVKSLKTSGKLILHHFHFINLIYLYDVHVWPHRSKATPWTDMQKVTRSIASWALHIITYEALLRPLVFKITSVSSPRWSDHYIAIHVQEGSLDKFTGPKKHCLASPELTVLYCSCNVYSAFTKKWIQF